ASKTGVMITSPRMPGRTPLSPRRIRTIQPRNHWPSDWATISGGSSSSAASVAAVGSGADSGASARAMRARLSIDTLSATGSAGRHVLDDTLAVKRRRTILRDHPPQVQHRDAVGDLEHIEIGRA